jgi:hypothetical protein
MLSPWSTDLRPPEKKPRAMNGSNDCVYVILHFAFRGPAFWKARLVSKPIDKKIKRWMDYRDFHHKFNFARAPSQYVFRTLGYGKYPFQFPLPHQKLGQPRSGPAKGLTKVHFTVRTCSQVKGGSAVFWKFETVDVSCPEWTIEPLSFGGKPKALRINHVDYTSVAIWHSCDGYLT